MRKPMVGALLIALSSTSAAAKGTPRRLVKTQGGLLLGVQEPTTEEYRGIPYAQPPVADLRWRPPRPPEPWHGVRDASRFGAPCVQQGDGEVIGEEDCLTLNVFAPAKRDKRLRPVMVHIHGGGNVVGRANQNPHVWTDRGVVLVTLNYRLGMLGFLAHPALTAESGGRSANLGLLDQRAALRWVTDNIAAFGGDPGNVTLFGISAGSFDTAAHVAVQARGGDPLFQRAVVQTAPRWEVGNTLAVAEEHGVEVAASLGCDGPDVLACLRTVARRAAPGRRPPRTSTTFSP
jgi:para-nitrobenzyl esterase